MSSLVPCRGCSRHVKSDETVCPFCRAALVAAVDRGACQGPCSGHAAPRLGRAALMVAGAALLCASCMRSGGVHYGLPGGAESLDAGGRQTVDAGSQPDAGIDSGDAGQ
jgi:hypothetical protein